MKTISLFLGVFLVGTFAMAGTLTYQVDYSKTKGVDENSLSLCGYPVEFQISSFAITTIASTFVRSLYSSENFTLENIQNASGFTVEDSAGTVYYGDFREKVYLVKQDASGVYEPGIYTRVQITTYDSAGSTKAFVVNSELINHRDKADLAEGMICGDVYYKLK